VLAANLRTALFWLLKFSHDAEKDVLAKRDSLQLTLGVTSTNDRLWCNAD
jgi:hypothetical protein